MMTMIHRAPNGCLGLCCEQFPIGASSAEETFQKLFSADFDEYVKIRSMLVVLKSDAPAKYTCKFWDISTRRCNNYVNRPEMCSTYPYDLFCRHCFLTIQQLENRILV